MGLIINVPPRLRGHSDHHERRAESTEHRTASEAGREDEAGCGVHPGGSGHGDCRCPATHTAKDQGKTIITTRIILMIHNANHASAKINCIPVNHLQLRLVRN